MSSRGRKQTQAARQALALRRSSHQKRTHDEEPESDVPPPTVKRVRSGTITTRSQATVDSAKIPSPSPARVRPRPKMRLPQPEDESSHKPGEHSPIEVPSNTNIIMMPGNTELNAPVVKADIAGAGAADIDSKPVIKTEKLQGERKEENKPCHFDADITMVDKSSEVELVDISESDPCDDANDQKNSHSVSNKAVKIGKKPLNLGNDIPKKPSQPKPKSTICEVTEDEEDAWNRDGEGDDEDRKFEVGRVKQGNFVLEYEVPRFKGVRILKLPSDASYWRFRHETGNIVENTSDNLQWGYSAGKKKDLKGKLTPRVIETEDDYKEMVDTAVGAIKEENDRFEKETRELEEAARNVKRKRGALSKKKAAPIEDYIIKLTVITVDEVATKKGKNRAGTKHKKSTTAFGAMNSDEEAKKSIAGTQLTWLGNLQRKRHCATHKRHCAILPGAQGEPGRHIRLEKRDLLQWSEALANHAPDVTIYTAPKCLKLHERLSDEEVDNRATRSDARDASRSTPGNAQAPTTPQHYPPMFYPGWPPFYPPPPPGSGAFPPNPYNTQAPMHNPPPQSKPSADPLLSEWLAQCDTDKTRGADGHGFASFLPQFEYCRLTRVSDVARFATPDSLWDAISERLPRMPYGTAAWLLDYAKADYQ
ncbi:hypothetical protein RhiJN_13206 [Ceratobasidium sp. AG-Ba]|nr:hypothetical protein RhiJN_13206 [Ceratobasidium sp. AG-Ba]